MTGRNCEPYVADCLASLARQQWQQFDVLFVDDASSDGTAGVARAALERLFPGRHRLQCNTESRGKACNAHELLLQGDAADFVAILDADDQLIDERILHDMAEAYAAGWDVVWSNYVTDQGGVGNNGPLDALASPRGQGWKSSHFFSFRHALFRAVPAHYLQDEEGRWLRAACDLAIAYPVLDQTRRYLHIPRNAYRYTSSNPESHHNRDAQAKGLNSREQQASAQVVLRKPPLSCTRFPSEAPAVQHGAMSTSVALLNAKLDRLQLQLHRLAQDVQQAPLTQIAVQHLVQAEHVPAAWLGAVGGWALDAGLLYHLCGVLDRYPSARVLEFGSGRGSKVLARLCANRGASLVSVEHDPKWYAETSQELQRRGLTEHASVRLAPLVDVEVYGIPGKFYDLSWLSPEDRFDIVIVDGPPALTCALARLPALPGIAAHLSTKGFHLYLDDYERAEERKIVEMWRKIAPELHYEALVFGKGVCEVVGQG
jgi:predicted O-methyltransferase YrrM